MINILFVLFSYFVFQILLLNFHLYFQFDHYYTDECIINATLYNTEYYYWCNDFGDEAAFFAVDSSNNNGHSSGELSAKRCCQEFPIKSIPLDPRDKNVFSGAAAKAPCSQPLSSISILSLPGIIIRRRPVFPG